MRFFCTNRRLSVRYFFAHWVLCWASKEELEIFHTPILERIIAGIRRFNGEPNVKERHPITRPVLRAMLTRLDKNT